MHNIRIYVDMLQELGIYVCFMQISPIATVIKVFGSWLNSHVHTLGLVTKLHAQYQCQYQMICVDIIFCCTQIEGEPEDYVLVCHSSGVTICMVENHSMVVCSTCTVSFICSCSLRQSLQALDEKEWRFTNIRGTSRSTNKKQSVSVVSVACTN